MSKDKEKELKKADLKKDLKNFEESVGNQLRKIKEKKEEVKEKLEKK